MASNTPNLGLYKKDPILDKTDTFSITTMLNENWDKIDEDSKEKDNKIVGLSEKVSLETPLNTTSQNLSGAVNEVKSDLDNHKVDLMSLKEQVDAPLYTTIETFERIVSLPPNTTKGQVDFSIKGETLTNIAKYSWSTSLAGWSGSAQSIVNNKYRITGISANTFFGWRSLQTVLDKSKNYLITVYVEANTDTDAPSDVIQLYEGESVKIKTSGGIGKNEKKRVGFVVSKSELVGKNDLRLFLNSRNIGYTDFSQFFIQEITDSDAFLSLDTLMQRYPYRTEGTKSTISAMRLKSVTENLFNYNNAVYGSNKRINSINGSIINGSSDSGDSYSEYIKIKENTSYQISGHTQLYAPYAIYDDNKNFIYGFSGNANTTTPNNLSNAKYIRISLLEKNKGAIQIKKSPTTTPYKPYKEDISYIVAKKDNKIVNLSSLPNGVKDEIRVSEGKLIKRVSDEYAFNMDNEYNLINVSTGADFYGIRIYNTPNMIIGTDINSYRLKNYNGLKLSSYVDWESYNGLATYKHQSSNIFYIKVPKTIGTLTKENVVNWFTSNQITLTYQLAVPEEIPVQVSNPLTVFEGGTILVDPYLRETYKITGTTITLDYPITSIDKLVKVDGITETVVTGALSTDGKTVTVTSAGTYRIEGEIRPEESTQGQKIIQVPINMKAQVNSNTDGIRMLGKIVDEHSLALLTLSLRNL